jgi:uncharacterized protein DUF222/HNH endonuclease
MDDRAAARMSGSELLSACDAIEDAIATLQARRLEVLQRMDEMKYAQEIGAHDTARLIEKRYRLDPAESRRRVRLAVALPKYPAVVAALPFPGSVIGDDAVLLSSAQAEAIVSALEKIPKSVNIPVEDLDAAAEQMVRAAEHMNPRQLRKMGEQVRNILDTDGPEPREDAARACEDVWVKKADDGVRFGGYLAGENAEKLQTVLQAGAKPHKTEGGALDPRSRGKRQADALIDVLDIALASGDLPTRGGIKPHIAVTIDLNDLLEAGRQATGDLTYGDGLSAAAIRRLACDAGFIPIVLGSDSQPLDVGREFRYVTNGLRNALNQRDRGCVICHAPPIYCDAHHLTSWMDGGVTSLANLVLLCRVDHTSLHDGHWTIAVVDNQVQVSRPSWADPPPRSTGRRLNPPGTTSANAPAPSAAAPWAPSSDTADASSATTATDLRSPSATTDGSPVPADADAWPQPITVDAPRAADVEPSRSATGAGTARATTGADVWSSWSGTDALSAPGAGSGLLPTGVEAASVTPDSAVRAQSSAVEAAGAEAAAGSPATPGWRWSYIRDIGWIGPEEAATIDPWGDHPTGAELSGTGGKPLARRERADQAPWSDSA